MLTNPVIRIVAGLALLLSPFAVPADDYDERYALLFAPQLVVGQRLEDWTEFFGPGYALEDVTAYPNTHVDEHVMVSLRIGDGTTSADFVVNLVNNQHFLVFVESTDPAFLDELGVDDSPLGAAGTAKLVDDWDMGVNELEISRRPDGTLAAEWYFYLD
jgi:hypothetical protein